MNHTLVKYIRKQSELQYMPNKPQNFHLWVLYKEVLFEGYAPFGIALLVETATNNNNRTVANVRSYFNKANGNLGTSGSVEFMFDRTCNFRINPEGVDPEELELEFQNFQMLKVKVVLQIIFRVSFRF